ncbi:DUF5801 repeats-in-toxin domain-containing protein, partial [Mesorhizobium sp. M0162]
MTTSNDLDTVSNSWDEHSSHEHGGPPSQAGIQVAQAAQAAPAEPVPVDVGSGAPVQPAAPAEAKAPAAAAPHEYVADASNIVKLPADVSIDNIKVDGHNLLLEQADGSVILIKDGALNVPTFIIGDVEVPRVALLAALEASHVDVAFGADGSISAGPGGAPGSAGGDFTIPPGGIGDGFDISALLPPTDLQFGRLEPRELTIGVREEDTTPTIDIGSGFVVNEAALSDGTDPASTAEQVSGTFNIVSGDGIGTLVIDGVDVTNGGSVAGQYGTLVVTGNPTNGYSWVYTLADNTLDHHDKLSTGTTEGVSDSFAVVVTDTDNEPATATLNIGVLDDGPTLSVQATVQAGQLLSVELDETVGGDRYNSGETEDAGGNANTDDGVGLAQVTTGLAGGLSSLFAVGGVYGADGPGSTTGQLAFTGIPVGGLATNLTATDGGAVTLFLEGGVIVGRDTQNNQVLTIAITGAPGAEQLQTTLYEALNHGADGNKFDSELNLALTNGGQVQLQYEVTRQDGDGDTVIEKATVDLIDGNGSAFSFDDDGPSLTVGAHDGAAGLLSVELDETVGADRYNGAIGETEDADGNANTDDAGPGLAQVNTAVSGGLTNLFTIGGSYGSDGPGTVTGTLSFTGIPAGGLATNLTATDGGAITLFLEGGVIVGRDTQNNQVLTIAITGAPGAEQLQTTLYEALNHGADGNKFDSELDLALTDGGQVQLQYEVTRQDGDGDTITEKATVDLIDGQGSAFSFDDDGPSLTVGAHDGAAGLLSVELDETVGTDRYNGGETEDAGGNANTDDGVGLAQVNTAVSGGLTNLFAIGGSYGSDGPGTVTGALSFTGIPAGGLATNLIATDGGAITLFLEGSVIVGRDTQNNQVLTIAITGAPGAEQLQTTLYEALNHGADGNKFDSELNLALTNGGQVQLQYEVTRQDGDGDTITENATVDLINGQGSAFSFDDDGPKVIGAAQVTANVDEDGLHNSQSTGNADNPQLDGEVTGTNSAVAIGAAGALNAIVDFGSDGPNATSAFGLVTQTTPSDSGFDSKGGNVLIVSDGTTLTGYVDVGAGAGYQAGTDRPVFTLTVGADGSYVFTLIDQIDHPTLPGDSTENTLANGGIDLSAFVVAKDGDGDTIGLAAGTFKVQVLDDVPQILARDAGTTTTTTTETIVYTLQAGNTDVRGMDGAGNHDIKLTGIDINEGDNSVNTTGTKIGVGDGQIIDGYETHPHLTGPEIVTMDFVNDLVITPNGPNPPSVSDSGSYDVASVKFTIDVAEAQGVEAAVMFIGAKDGGTFEPFTVSINGVLTAGTAVFEGGVQVGYAFADVPDGATVEVIGSTPFDQLKVGNYNDFTFDSNAGGTDATLTGGNPFKIFGIEAKITTVTTQTEVFRVSHDESAGVNNAADPNPANDTALPPPALVTEPDALGYAKSSASALGLFNASVGADDDATFSFAVTDANGNPLANIDSGLKTLDGLAIMLSTNADGVLVGSANGIDVFKVYVDPTGAVWIGQYQPIAHNVDGSSTAAFDDIATVAADLHVKATITDFDGDTSTAVSHVALSIEFQDDGPVAVDDQDSVTEEGPLTADGNVITGVGGADANATDGHADHLGTDGLGSITWDGADADHHVAGTYGELTVGADGSYSYALYTQAQNPTAYAAVQALSVGESLSETFDYTLTDGDGDTAPASLTITVNGADDIVTISGLTPQTDGGDTVVDEKGLPPRGSEPAGSGELQDANPTNNSDHSETNGGTFAFTSPDGLGSLQVGTTSISYAQLSNSGAVPIVIAGGPVYGTLTITGFSGTNAGGTVSYSFTLTDNVDHPGTGVVGAADQLFANYAVVVTDEDTSSSSSTLSIAINDDGPVAHADTDSVASNQFTAETGNVLSAVGTTSPVTGID